ncbi:MAG: c-type cytochrome [Anaerolineales bacterium]|nr:c-type cytochrome [Anaerolineales bacterium]
MSRFNIEILLGIILVSLTTVLLVVYGFNEEERMEKESETQHAQAIEVGASLFENNCSGCHGIKGEGITGLCPPLNDGEFFTTRMKEVGWSGSLEDYINSVVSSGRAASTRPDEYAGQGSPAMPAWSDQYGGPLREDQIFSISQFVLNWESTALEDVVLEELATPTPGPEEASDPIARGQRVYLDTGCGGCHTIEGLSAGTVGPNQTHIAAVSEVRIPGMSAEEYIRQSVLEPSAYVVDGYPDNVMPKNYSELLAPDQLSDLVAFFLSLE